MRMLRRWRWSKDNSEGGEEDVRPIGDGETGASDSEEAQVAVKTRFVKTGRP